MESTTIQKKKLFIKTYGCQMNVYDSTRMADILQPMGYETTSVPDDADMVILNTCHIREKAAEKMYSDIGRLKEFKKAKADIDQRMILAVAGCVAQAEGKEIMRRSPAVDMVFGPQTYHRLPEMLIKATEHVGGSRYDLVETDFPTESKFDRLPEELTKAPINSIDRTSAAFLTVQEGCDKFCTFCVVPYTRGAEFSRPVADITAEAQKLIANGVREITLLGQNVNAWHGKGDDDQEWGLGRLINHMATLDGLDRLRFTTSHPCDMSDDLYEAYKNQPKLMPYLHLPVQAGSDKILEAMNRHHTADEYRRIIDRLRDARPDVALSGDFIVGFPGETDKDFADTLKLVTDVGYAQAYSFKYSPRPGTPAATDENQVPEEVKAERLQTLQALLNEQQYAFNQSKVGTTMHVLMERQNKKNPHQLVGRSPYMQSVHVTGNERLVGQIVDVVVQTAHSNSITGDIKVI